MQARIKLWRQAKWSRWTAPIHVIWTVLFLWFSGSKLQVKIKSPSQRLKI